MKRRTEFRWAVFFALVQIAWLILGKGLGFHDERIDTFESWNQLFSVPAILLVLMVLRDKRRKDFGGSMSYGQGMITGLVFSVFVGLFSVLINWVFLTWYTPELLSNYRDFKLETGVSEEAAPLTHFVPGNYALISFFSSVSLGVLTTAVLMFFLRSRH